MKKNYFTLTLMLLITSFSMQAQVANGDFENIKDNFLPRNWGMNFFQQFTIDAQTGEVFGDQIQYTWCIPSMVYASFEPKSGVYAMEVSNAYNWTTDEVIPGVAEIFNDPEQDFPGWNPGADVEPGSSVIMLGFDYKFLPAGNDVAEAYLTVTDELGGEIGSASVEISGTHSEYTYVYAPMSIIHAGTPTKIYISFNMAKAGSTPTFGTRLVVDNVVTNFSTLITGENENKTAKVFPTIVDNEINIIPNSFDNAVSYKVINSEGRVVKQTTVNQDSEYQYTMNLSDLSAGVYFLNIQDKTKNSTKKFIKK